MASASPSFASAFSGKIMPGRLRSSEAISRRVPNLMSSAFDDGLLRPWEHHLADCEAGFLSGNIAARQIVFAKSK
jgi:cyclopropane fatty-acyl-phospholipid synthase-like methyltransferase